MTLNGAIKQLHELRSAEDMPIYYRPAIAEVINVLLMDTQEVRHCHWVIEHGETVMHCNSCGWAYDYYGGLEEEWNYCPNCGAKMDENEWEEPEINPCRGCVDYDGQGGCKSNGGCGAEMDEVME